MREGTCQQLFYMGHTAESYAVYALMSSAALSRHGIDKIGGGATIK